MPSAAAEIFHQAARLNTTDPRRRGNVVVLEGTHEILVSGDLHGNRAVLNRILAYADLAHEAGRLLVLQEIAHGPPDPRSGQDRSIELLLRAARMKVERPEQVLFVLANHDLAQITGNEISKAGRRVCQAFSDGVHYAFGPEGAEVLTAVEAFLMSLPLAIHCPNRVRICHTLPDPARMDLAGTEIFDRPYEAADLRRGGAVYEWTWGRKQTPEQIDQLASELDVDFFVLAHKHIESGCEMLSPRAIVVVSDHDHGGVLQFSTDAPLTGDNAAACFKPTVAMVKET